MSDNKSVDYGLAIDVGNTKIHIQARNTEHKLIYDGTVPTAGHDTLADVLRWACAEAVGKTGGKPGFVGAGIGGPIDAQTGAAKLSLVTKFDDSVTPSQVSEMFGGVPIVLLNDVEASAYALSFPQLELSVTSLTHDPLDLPGPYVLTEIGTGVGVACFIPAGAVIPSEAMRVHANNGIPYGLNLSGNEGFINLVDELSSDGVKLPPAVVSARDDRSRLGPLITDLVAHYESEFAVKACDLYARHLGDYLGLLQLTFLASRLYLGGSVNRAPGWLERIISTDAFWKAFAKEDALRGRDMPIFRVADKDATVKGVYAAAVRNYESQLTASGQMRNDLSVV